MYVINDIAYAENYNNTELKIQEVKVIDVLCMLITFSNGTKRIFDASFLLNYPAYQSLNDFEIFKNPYIDHGTLTWCNGAIDISTETVYENSFVYENIS